MRLLPRDTAFFDLFDAQVAAVVESAAAFGRLAADFSQLFFPSQIQCDLSIIPDDELAPLIEESLLLSPVNLTVPGDELEFDKAWWSAKTQITAMPVPMLQSLAGWPTKSLSGSLDSADGISMS